jgi:hypothetical protein
MDEREELEETLDLLRYAFEELKEIRDKMALVASLDADRIQQLIWKIGKELGEF